MSILIKGMEMPLACSACPMIAEENSTHYEHCVIGWRQLPFDEVKPSWCPLVPLPEKHGRLIDADAVREEIDRLRSGRCYEDAWALTVMDNAPTIIEAEGGGGMTELKPCPFCGNKHPQTVVDDETETLFGVCCFECAAQISATFEERDEAENAWNRRSDNG